MKLKHKILFYILGFAGNRLFRFADIYAPNDRVKAITFSNSKKYMIAVSEIEFEGR